MLSEDETFATVPPSICVRSRPTPPVTYGRMPAPCCAADRHAEDDVAHEIDDGVVAEVVLRAEEARAVAEVEFAADDARAHGAGVHAEAPSGRC